MCASQVPEERVARECGYLLFYSARGLDLSKFLPNVARGQQPGAEGVEEDEAEKGASRGFGSNCVIS